MIKDEEGRIKYLDPKEDSKVHTGHSVCNTCRKDMPICWEVVCKTCNRTFCYEHAVLIEGYWCCLDCAEEDVED